MTLQQLGGIGYDAYKTFDELRAPSPNALSIFTGPLTWPQNLMTFISSLANNPDVGPEASAIIFDELDAYVRGGVMGEVLAGYYDSDTDLASQIDAFRTAVGELELPPDVGPEPPLPPDVGPEPPPWEPGGLRPLPYPTDRMTMIPGGEIVPYVPETGQQAGQPPPGWTPEHAGKVLNVPPATWFPFGTPGVEFNEAAPPQEYHLGAPKLREDVTPADSMLAYMINETLPYLDPWSRRSAMQWIYRTNPMQYGRYKDITHEGGTVPYRESPPDELPPGLPPRPPIFEPGDPYSLGAVAPLETRQELKGYLTPERMGTIIGQLGYDNIVSELDPGVQKWLKGEAELSPIPSEPGGKIETKWKKEEGIQAATNIKAALKWLEEALTTVKGGVGEDKTRADQLLAAQHLDTLYREADEDMATGGFKNLSSYRTLVENLANPVIRRAPVSGLFGVMRGYIPRKDEYRRGGWAWRNPAAL